MSVERQPINAENAPAAVGPYSHAVRSGGFLFLSGQTPLDPATGKLVEGDIGRGWLCGGRSRVTGFRATAT